MRRSPTDPEFRLALKELGRRFYGAETQLIWVGFDNRGYLHTLGPLLSALNVLYSETFAQRICWKALVYVTPKGPGMTRATAIVLGTGEVYALNVYASSGEYWAEADSDTSDELRRFRVLLRS